MKQIDHDEGNEKEFISTSFIILSNLILTPFMNHEHLTRKKFDESKYFSGTISLVYLNEICNIILTEVSHDVPLSLPDFVPS